MRKMLLAALLLSFQLNVPAHAGNEETNAAHPPQSDYADAFAYWQPLAQQGNPEAQYTLALMYDLGQGTEKNPEQAITWLRKAAGQDFAAARYTLGTKYLHGNGVAIDEDEAIRWFTPLVPSQAAAALASPYAQLVIYELGGKYAATPETPRDYSVTFPWFDNLAREGNPFAQYYLGMMHERGLGTSVDTAESRKWFEKAAAGGVAAAMEKLADFYRDGRNITASPVMAYALLDLAAADRGILPQNRERILGKRQQLAENLSAAERGQAEKLKQSLQQPGNFVATLHARTNSPR